MDSCCTPRKNKGLQSVEKPLVEFPYTSLDLSFQMVPRMQFLLPTRQFSSTQNAKPPCPVVWDPTHPLIVMSTRLGRKRVGVAHRSLVPPWEGGSSGAQTKALLHCGCTRTPQNTAPCSLVKQGRLGRADNGRPTGRSGCSSAGHSWRDTRGNPCWPRWYLRWR